MRRRGGVTAAIRSLGVSCRGRGGRCRGSCCRLSSILGLSTSESRDRGVAAGTTAHAATGCPEVLGPMTGGRSPRASSAAAWWPPATKIVRIQGQTVDPAEPAFVPERSTCGGGRLGARRRPRRRLGDHRLGTPGGCARSADCRFSGQSPERLRGGCLQPRRADDPTDPAVAWTEGNG